MIRDEDTREDVEQTNISNDFYKEWEVNRSSPCDLYVRNKTDEFIATLKGIGPSWWPEKLVVAGYCRDPDVLAFKPNMTHSHASYFDKLTGCRMRCFNDKNNLSGFYAYLKERGKAACANDPVNFVHYFLTTGDVDGDLILMRRPMRRAVSLSVPNKVVAKKAPPQLSRTEQLERLRLVTKQRLMEFIANKEEDSLAFEPMNELGRDVVMGEIAEFPELVDCLEGEMIDERHIVAYKKDRLPEESVVTTVDVVRVKREAKSTQVKTVQPVGHTEVISVQGKRDRRTVADIMKATEKRPKTDS